MPATIQLSPVVQEILARSIMTDTTVALPQQLDRQTYEAVDKVLKAAGGKWSRSMKAHVFPRDPREALGLAVSTGEITNQKVALQQFFTPGWLARDMAAEAGIEDQHRVLEPSAGTGMLAFAAALYTPRRYISCYEIDAQLTPLLREAGFRVMERDFLAADPVPAYDHVLMNPPFMKYQDMAHILRALEWLKPHGTMQAIASGTVMVGSTKLHTLFQERMEALDAQITSLPDDTFEEAGTCVRTVRIALTLPA